MSSEECVDTVRNGNQEICGVLGKSVGSEESARFVFICETLPWVTGHGSEASGSRVPRSRAAGRSSS